MFNKKSKKEQNISENINKFVENIDNTIQNYKNYNKINSIYVEKIVKSIIKTIFFTKEFFNPYGTKYGLDTHSCIKNSEFFILNEKGMTTIINEANNFVNNNTRDDVIKFINYISSENFKIRLECAGFVANICRDDPFNTSAIQVVPSNINMKNIFDNKDSYFEHIISTVDFSTYKQTEFPKSLMTEPYKCYLEHLIESNKPVVNQEILLNGAVVHSWDTAYTTMLNAHIVGYEDWLSCKKKMEIPNKWIL